MEAFRRIIGASPVKHPPPVLATDEIFPLHFLDDTKTLREIVVTWTLRFNDVLDPDRLQASLSRLLDIGDWRKLGGRLRLKENEKLEVHVPTPFTMERPAITYTHQAFRVNIDDHPLAESLPKATDGPSIQAGPEAFRIFAAREDAPAGLEDFIYNDIPQLSLHITSFNDATLVALLWPHTLMDVIGQQALLQAWSLVLAGRDSEVQPMIGAREDAISSAADASVGQENKEVFQLGLLQLKGWKMVKFVLRFGWDMLWNRVVETRTIFLPKRIIFELQRQAREDVAVLDSGEGGVFVSEGDILTAWTTRAIASSLPQPRAVTVLRKSLQHLVPLDKHHHRILRDLKASKDKFTLTAQVPDAINARFRLPSLLHAQGVFVQNMAMASFAFLSPKVLAQSLGAVALENRRHLTEQSTEGQILACLRHLRSRSHDPSMICGDPDALLVPYTNWTRANIFQAANFSAAVVRAGDTRPSRTNPPGSILFHHAQSMKPNAASRNVVVVLGKDGVGNYWLTGILLPEAWAKIEEEIKKM